jgi:hypothetical protein
LSPRVSITDAHDIPDGISSNANYEMFFGSAIPSTVAPVPEPSTWLLLGTGLVGLALYGWRKRR